MGAFNPSLLIDIVLAGLLGVLIFYAVRLHKAFSALRQSKEEMQALFAEFSSSTEKAENAIARMKEASGENGAYLSELLQKAEILRDDLNFLIERGEKAASSLEIGVASARGRVPSASPPHQGNPSTRPVPTAPVSAREMPNSVEDEIAAAVREARQLAAEEGDPMLRRAAEDPQQNQPALSRTDSEGALQADLERRLAGPDMASAQAAGAGKSLNETDAARGADSQSGDDAPKSRSALLRALQGMR